ncbi:hypothetical protein [Coraliomargarita parva]|uniref:hypothetical protein n=1 Tax=Coraliomargarita parva TaxID=3014050 RepID=UPI0022B2F9E6|nr:hypothetical protein [Coraliomargarita parva]
MPADESDYTQPSLFDDTAPAPSADAITTQEIAQFLRKKSARRQLSEDVTAKTAPRIYWHKGNELSFFERVPHRLSGSPYLEARTSVFDYERPQHAGQALAEWIFSGDTLPGIGARFRVFDLKAAKWIGSGRVAEDRDTVFAFLVAGLWSDFYKFEHDCSGLVLVIFDGARP